jgi:hypothetical protein
MEEIRIMKVNCIKLKQFVSTGRPVKGVKIEADPLLYKKYASAKYFRIYARIYCTEAIR